MCKATIHLLSPSGVPVTLEVAHDDDQKIIIDTLARADKIGGWCLAHGWSTAHAEPAGPSARELAQGPTFAGYPCSPTVDAQGLPTWIIVDGKQAQRREKQGDAWYSIKAGDDNYVQVLRIPKGEKAPAVLGLDGPARSVAVLQDADYVVSGIPSTARAAAVAADNPWTGAA